MTSAVLGAVLYGSWAVTANGSHGCARALRAGLTQAMLTFTLTLVVTALMEVLHRLPRRPASRVAAAASGAFALATTCSLSVHTLLGTPEILRTAGPLLAIGVVFNVLYALNLERVVASRREEAR
jgi:hypothetical protein